MSLLSAKTAQQLADDGKGLCGGSVANVLVNDIVRRKYCKFLTKVSPS